MLKETLKFAGITALVSINIALADPLYDCTIQTLDFRRSQEEDSVVLVSMNVKIMQNGKSYSSMIDGTPGAISVEESVYRGIQIPLAMEELRAMADLGSRLTKSDPIQLETPAEIQVFTVEPTREYGAGKRLLIFKDKSGQVIDQLLSVNIGLTRCEKR